MMDEMNPARRSSPQCFSCTFCGDCCSGDQAIRLNPDDLERLRAYLKLDSVDELYTRGYVIPSSESEPRPIIRFQKKPVAQCPFLENSINDDGRLKSLCVLHPHFKPLVCSLAPLAREVEDDGTSRHERWFLIPPAEGCPGMGKGDTVDVDAPDEFRERLDNEAQWMRKTLAKRERAGCEKYTP